jgi:putative acetyltransferase
LQALIREYVQWLDMDLSYRGFEQEMGVFDSLFTRPSGFFLLAHAGDALAACVGLLRHDDLTAEVKRLYVRPAYRGHQLGERLMQSLLQEARAAGFARLILDAVPPTVMAQKLYRTLGFVNTAPYYANPTPGTQFFELALHASECASQPVGPAMQLEPISLANLDHVAAIHAASWRSAYRGILQDAFLDGDLATNRQALWTKRLTPNSPDQFGYLALDQDHVKALGFVYAYAGADPQWGTLLDNLHVMPDCKGQGIGRGLLKAIAQHGQAANPEQGLYLWVYERNTAAQQFYAALGGERGERIEVTVAGGGTAPEWRYSWASPAALLAHLS